MRKDSPLAKLDVIRSKDLQDLPLICLRQRLPSKKLTGWFKKDYESLNIVVTFNLLYNATFLVEEGIGYILCLDKLAKTAGNELLTFRPLEPRVEAHMDIVWKKYQIFSKAAEIFLQKMQERFLDS